MTKTPKLIAGALVVTGLVAAATPWRIPRAGVADAFGGGLVRSAGFDATVAGHVSLKLLPRPRIQASDLTVSSRDGAVMVDAPLVKAELDIPSLLRGRWRITSATLVEPTVTLDLDRFAAHRPVDVATIAEPIQLRLRSGVLRTRSTTAFADLLVTRIDASATWPADGGALVVAGDATWRGTATQFTGILQHPLKSVAPEGTVASLQVESSLFDMSADGVLSGGTQEQFTGRASLTTSSLPKLIRTLDGVPLAIATKRAQITGDIVAKPYDLSISEATVRLDRSRFEGTLAWRRDAGHGLVVGTLATDLLDADALLGKRLDGDALDALYRRPLDTSLFGTDIDVRISASAARIGKVRVDDAAVAALVRGDRFELTLDEARAYGGLVKARVLANLGPDGIDAHAELSAKRLDLALLSGGLSGQERASGSLTGHAALDGRGTSLRNVVAGLAGQGELEIEDGRLAGLSLAQSLRRLGRRLPLGAERGGTPTTFDRARWDVSVRDGVVRIPEGKLTAPGVAMSFGAETTLPDGRIAVHALAAQTDGGGAPLQDGQRLPFDMRGSWAGPLTMVAHATGLPSFAVPLLGDTAPLR